MKCNNRRNRAQWFLVGQRRRFVYASCASLYRTVVSTSICCTTESGRARLSLDIIRTLQPSTLTKLIDMQALLKGELDLTADGDVVRGAAVPELQLPQPT